MQCTAMHWNELQYTEMHCNLLQYTALHFITPHLNALNWTALYFKAIFDSMLSMDFELLETLPLPRGSLSFPLAPYCEI